MKNIFRRNITKDQCRDTGMAMVLLFFILFAVRKRETLLGIAAVLHIINMIVPRIYKPVAIIWLAISDGLGAVVSRVLMSIVFFAVVTPIGFVRRVLGKDSLKLRAFKMSDVSVMLERNHVFASADIEKPY